MYSPVTRSLDNDYLTALDEVISRIIECQSLIKRRLILSHEDRGGGLERTSRRGVG